jgi:TorA maturation chaperone TorD
MDRTTTPIEADPVLLLARRTCYRFVALALADPRYGTFDQLIQSELRELVAEAAQIVREEEAAVARPLALGERPLADLDPTMVFANMPKSAAELNALYEDTFGLLAGSKCPPYETEYVPSKFTFQRSNLLADVAGFYRAFGLQTSSSHPDRADHVALECEFLAQLLQLQFRSTSHVGTDTALFDNVQNEVCRNAMRCFLQNHFVWWTPSFAEILARQGSHYHKAVGQFLSALIAAERAIAGIGLPHRLAEASPIENADECAGCGFVQ